MAQQITADDIKLYASEKLNDAPDAGGRVTANEIESGQINNVFQDISRVDHVNGAVELRKLFMGIRTDNNAPLLGAHMIVQTPPEDENVNAIIFQTPKQGREIDQRTAARDYLETYYVKSARGVSQVLGLNLAGAKVLTLFQTEQATNDLEAGDTIVLVDSSNDAEEYVKIQQLSEVTQTFVYLLNNAYHTFTGRVVQCQLPVPLLNSWDGGEARPNGVQNTAISVYNTTITDAANYRGVSQLTEAADDGATVIKVKDVLQPLVPVAKTETALVDKSPYATTALIAPAAGGTQTLTASLDAASEIFYLPTAVARGTLIVSASGTTWTDDQTGRLVLQSGALSIEGRVDYASGQINLTGIGARSVTAQWTPAGAITRAGLSGAIDITQGSLGLVYTIDLSAVLPAPGSLVVRYIANGEWQELRDTGAGTLAGDGTGTVSYQSGAVQANLIREPDIDSKIVYTYLQAGADSIKMASGLSAYNGGDYQQQINFDGPIEPGTLSISVDGDTYTSTDDGEGEVTGTAGTGRVDYAAGVITLSPIQVPAAMPYEVTANTGTRFTDSFAPSVAGQGVSIALGAGVKPGTFSATLTTKRTTLSEYNKSSWAYMGGTPSAYNDVNSSETTATLVHKFTDDGQGGILKNGAATGGTINYTTGAVNFGSVLKKQTVSTFTGGNNVFGFKVGKGSTMQITESVVGSVVARWVSSFDDFVSDTQTITINAATARITDPDEVAQVVPGSLVLTIDGSKYYDANGRIITDYSPITGTGVQVGAINYATGELSLPNLGNVSISVDALLLATKSASADYLFFVVPQVPLRQASLQLNVALIDGSTHTIYSELDGTLKWSDDDAIVGNVNFDNGIVNIDLDDLDGETQAVLGTMRYNAVNVVTLPLDPDIVGLNVQRLPIDGRVPVFKVGDTAVLTHTDAQAIDTPTAGATIAIDRDHLAEVHIFADGEELDATQYVADLEAGSVTFADPLTLQNADAQPITGAWTIQHRIEHMSLITRVQLNGLLSLQVASAHEFPQGSAVSSALLFGDLQADVSDVFAQKTWQNNNPNWTNTPDESGGTTAQFDTINYPIVVNNQSAVTDKWALVFRTSNSVDVVSESLGVIASNVSIGGQIAPINPVTGTAYFVIEANGWGGGWATSNALRFDTTSALAPFWIARTVTPAQGITESDSFTLSPRGDSQ